LNEPTRKHGIGCAIYFNWRANYGGVSVSELERMKELEAENAKLKRYFASARDLVARLRASHSRIDDTLHVTVPPTITLFARRVSR
jgi:hypothetical protein